MKWADDLIAIAKENYYIVMSKKTNLRVKIKKELIYEIDHNYQNKNRNRYSKYLLKLEEINYINKSYNKDFHDILFPQNTTTLNTLQVELTSKCNLQCIHCYQQVFENDKCLTFNRLKAIVDNAKENGFFRICLTGGEPLLHPDFFRILSYLNTMNFIIEIYTNGYLLTDEIIRHLATCNVGLVKVSIDGVDTHTHNVIRRSNMDFSILLNKILKLKESGINVKINTMVHKDLLTQIPQYLALMREYNLQFCFDRIVNFSNDHDCENILVPTDQYVDALLSILPSQLNRQNSVPQSNSFCGYGLTFLYISTNGLVKLCPSFPDTFNIGNIFETPFNEIIENFKKSDLRLMQCSKINSCEYSDQCNGGCRNKAYVQSGNINDPDLDMCLLLRKIKEYGGTCRGSWECQ